MRRRRDRKSVVKGKRGYLGGCRIVKKKRKAMPDAATFCWNGTFWSTVRNPSKPSASISLRSSALRLLDHPRSRTVLTSCPASSRLSGRGTHSSSRSRTSFCHLTPELQCRNRLVASDTGEVVQKLVQGIACFEIVVERLDRHPSAHEDWSSAEDVGVTVNHTLLSHGRRSGLRYLSIHQGVVGA